jgi:uncharacterized protein YbbK (DUF523 family)
MTAICCSTGRRAAITTDDETRTEWARLQRLLDFLADAVAVCPGATMGRPVPRSAWSATNRFLRCPELVAFVAVTRDWPSVKRRLGLK